MHAILTKVHTMLDAHLGRCGKCIRQAFLAALGAWIFAVAVWAVAGRNGLTDAASVIAVGLTALWTAHLIAYAVRSVATSEGPQVSATKVTSRREVIPGFARALGLIALATVLPASSVFAANCCDCSKCSSSQVCCKTANGCCGCFPGSIRCP